MKESSNTSTTRISRSGHCQQWQQQELVSSCSSHRQRQSREHNQRHPHGLPREPSLVPLPVARPVYDDEENMYLAAGDDDGSSFAYVLIKRPNSETDSCSSSITLDCQVALSSSTTMTVESNPKRQHHHKVHSETVLAGGEEGVEMILGSTSCSNRRPLSSHRRQHYNNVVDHADKHHLHAIMQHTNQTLPTSPAARRSKFNPTQRHHRSHHLNAKNPSNQPSRSPLVASLPMMVTSPRRSSSRRPISNDDDHRQDHDDSAKPGWISSGQANVYDITIGGDILEAKNLTSSATTTKVNNTTTGAHALQAKNLTSSATNAKVNNTSDAPSSSSLSTRNSCWADASLQQLIPHFVQQPSVAWSQAQQAANQSTLTTIATPGACHVHHKHHHSSSPPTASRPYLKDDSQRVVSSSSPTNSTTTTDSCWASASLMQLIPTFVQQPSIALSQARTCQAKSLSRKGRTSSRTLSPSKRAVPSVASPTNPRRPVTTSSTIAVQLVQRHNNEYNRMDYEECYPSGEHCNEDPQKCDMRRGPNAKDEERELVAECSWVPSYPESIRSSPGRRPRQASLGWGEMQSPTPPQSPPNPATLQAPRRRTWRNDPFLCTLPLKAAGPFRRRPKASSVVPT